MCLMPTCANCVHLTHLYNWKDSQPQYILQHSTQCFCNCFALGFVHYVSANVCQLCPLIITKTILEISASYNTALDLPVFLCLHCSRVRRIVLFANVYQLFSLNLVTCMQEKTHTSISLAVNTRLLVCMLCYKPLVTSYQTICCVTSNHPV